MPRPVVDPELNGHVVATKPLLCAVPAAHIPASSIYDFRVSFVPLHLWLPRVQGFPKSMASVSP